MKFLVAVLVAFALTGCVTRYVELPEDLTRAMETHTPKDQSTDEAVNLANKRAEVIDDGNSRFEQIRVLQGTKVKKSTKPGDVENGSDTK